MADKVEDQRIRENMGILVKAWETGKTELLDQIIAEAAWIDFTMYGRNIGREKLKKFFEDRSEKISYISFELLNYVCAIEKNLAVVSSAMIGIFADKKEEKWSRFGFEGNFANRLIKTEDGWKFSSIKFELTDEDSTRWAWLFTGGIPEEKGRGDLSFVPAWICTKHDDRVGWFPGRRIPVINAEFDAPWLAIKNRENQGTDEEQIQETFFRYAYGIDNNCFKLYDDVFTEDAVIMYSDDRPYDKRSVTEMLKAERLGSCRCTHTGFFTDVKVDGDTAKATLYLRGPLIPDEYELTDEMMNTRLVWARYHLNYVKQNGKWLIQRLNFYMGFLKK